MIIKLRTCDDGWTYFEVKQGFKVRQLTDEQWEFVWDNKDEHYCEVDLAMLSKEGNFVSVINIYKQTCIYTNKVAYLLNDEGKTIEKIN